MCRGVKRRFPHFSIGTSGKGQRAYVQVAGRLWHRSIDQLGRHRTFGGIVAQELILRHAIFKRDDGLCCGGIAARGSDDDTLTGQVLC